jgi:hypothetical protein
MSLRAAVASSIEELVDQFQDVLHTGGALQQMAVDVVHFLETTGPPVRAKFQRLDLAMVPDSYPIPNMMDFAAKAAGCTIFSKINLKSGYHQVSMNPADIPKKPITTPFGLWDKAGPCMCRELIVCGRNLN